MRMIFLVAILMPSIACAADWVELARTPEARILMDKASIETLDGGARASLKFLYHKKQPGQTITSGKPFDNSVNQYYLVCSTKKFQVLQLTMYYKMDTVGSFHADLNLDKLIDAKPETGVMYLLNKVCT